MKVSTHETNEGAAPPRAGLQDCRGQAGGATRGGGSAAALMDLGTPQRVAAALGQVAGLLKVTPGEGSLGQRGVRTGEDLADST